MAKINKSDIYIPDTTPSREDTWAGSDAQIFFKTKTLNVGGIEGDVQCLIDRGAATINWV